MVATISHHNALIYTMVLVSAADRDMTDNEIATIGESIRTLPVFRDYDLDQLGDAAETCAEILDSDEGLDTVLGLIKEGLPKKLHETAYSLACEIAAADGKLSQEELRLLEIIRHELEVGRLPAAAIERGVRARYATI
ncbi:MAG: tellurite resistance TerB family protein [Minwuiales bacterium]|nr:tellurite resistance TerB family protein [Minwuiales bacterium]